MQSAEQIGEDPGPPLAAFALRKGGAQVALFGALSLTLAVTPAAADITTACADTIAFPDAIVRLTSEGWTVQTNAADLTEAQIDALAWTLMTGYLGGDDGGEDIATLMDLQRRSARGLMARRDTDTTNSRVLTDDDGVLTVTQTRTLPGRVERICRLATTRNAPAGVTLIDTTDVDGAPEILAEIATILTEETKP